MDVDNKDVFLISAEAEIRRFSRLMNKASKTYHSLKDNSTQYAESLFACYTMNKINCVNTQKLVKEYKRKMINGKSDAEEWLNSLSWEERKEYV